MNAPIRPPPLVLLIHDGNIVDEYLVFLRTAGLEAVEAHADSAVSEAVALKRDVIVLDFELDGEIVAALQGDDRTRRIPVIALADLPLRQNKASRSA
jgi:CheY-like chemotaxis protein